MKVLVTGPRGFIARNLMAHLQTRTECLVMRFDRGDPETDLRAALETAEIIYHLAGVNRPEKVEEFETGNAGLTRQICDILRSIGRKPKIVMSSSIQAGLENPYGKSKRRAEAALKDFATETGAPISIHRLTNVFGKWSRPNYNSVVATFCHNIANDLPIQISDPARELEVAYIDDVVAAFIAELPTQTGQSAPSPIPSFRIRLGDLAARLKSFHDICNSLMTPDFSVRFQQQLFATYLSYVPDDQRRHQLQIKSDNRGGLAEFMKSNNFGQVFISRTRPGITRGNHYHHTKTEKFLVVEGQGVIRMRQVESSHVVEYRIRGEEFQVVDIPPGYVHSIENVGDGDMVTLFWSSEIFDPDKPDTYFVPVQAPSETDAPVNA